MATSRWMSASRASRSSRDRSLEGSEPVGRPRSTKGAAAPSRAMPSTSFQETPGFRRWRTTATGSRLDPLRVDRATMGVAAREVWRKPCAEAASSSLSVREMA